MTNIVGEEERVLLWIPGLVFGNSVKESQIKIDSFSTLTIAKVGNSTASYNEFLQENEWFDGNENSIMYSRYYKMEFSCDFEQHYFPFDHQECKIQVQFISQ
jgi:hypothetical protein